MHKVITLFTVISLQVIIIIMEKGKGKVIPITGVCGPEGG